MTEVRCCCDPDNLLGHLPESDGLAAGLKLRELDDGSKAFDSNDNEDFVKSLPTFEPAVGSSESKTWKEGKKTWRKK